MDFRFSPSLAGFARNPKRFLKGARGEVRLVVSGIGIGEERQANRAKYPCPRLRPKPQPLLQEPDRVSRSTCARSAPAAQKVTECLPIRKLAIIGELRQLASDLCHLVHIAQKHVGYPGMP